MRDKIIKALIDYDIFFIERDFHIQLSNGIITYNEKGIRYQDIEDSMFSVTSKYINDIIGVLELKYS